MGFRYRIVASDWVATMKMLPNSSKHLSFVEIEVWFSTETADFNVQYTGPDTTLHYGLTSYGALSKFWWDQGTWRFHWTNTFYSKRWNVGDPIMWYKPIVHVHSPCCYLWTSLGWTSNNKWILFPWWCDCCCHHNDALLSTIMRSGCLHGLL